jgi:hypothetical protein
LYDRYFSLPLLFWMLSKWLSLHTVVRQLLFKVDPEQERQLFWLRLPLLELLKVRTQSI